MLAGDLHGRRDIAGTQGCHQRHVVSARLVRQLDLVGEEVGVELRPCLVVGRDGGNAPCAAGSPPSIRRTALRIWLSVTRRGRPPRSFPALRRSLIESMMRSRLMACSICASAAMIVNSIDPIGVDVSTSPPPRFNTRRPAPRSRSTCAKSNMFCIDRPSRSKVVMTSVSPASRAPSARSNCGRDARAPETP